MKRGKNTILFSRSTPSAKVYFILRRIHQPSWKWKIVNFANLFAPVFARYEIEFPNRLQMYFVDFLKLTREWSKNKLRWLIDSRDVFEIFFPRSFLLEIEIIVRCEKQAERDLNGCLRWVWKVAYHNTRNPTFHRNFPAKFEKRDWF